MGYLFLIALLASCGPHAEGSNDQAVTSNQTVVPTPTLDLEKYDIGEQAMVDFVEPVFLESFPLQVQVQISGNLPDGCTKIYKTESNRENKIFDISIIIIREKNAICTQALVPFEVNVPLDVYGLPAGDYQVLVYDVTAKFTFTQDNIIQEPEMGN